MSTASEPRGSVEVALERTAHLLDVDPALAVEQAQEILMSEFVPEEGNGG